MSYQTFDRNPSGIVFFGTSASDQVFESNANFTIDGTSLLATNLKISNGGNIGSASDPNAISISSAGDVSFTQDVSIAGDLTVNGTTTTVNTTNLSVEDSIIELNRGVSGVANTNDAGFIFQRGTTGNDSAFIWDESDDKFKLGTTTGSATDNTLTVTAGTLVADLEGNADTATALETARAFSLTGEVTASAVNFDGTGAVALSTTLANSAITGQGAKTSAASNDLLLIADSADSFNLKKVTKGQFISDLGGGTMSSFTLAGDSGSSQTIEDSNTMTLTGGVQSMISVAAGATDTATFNITSSIAGTGVSFDNSQGISVTAGTGIAVDGNGVHANLTSYTVQTTAANSITTTASRTYSVQVDSSDKLVVNVPWTDVNELTTEEVEDIVGAMVGGASTQTLITVSYDDTNGELDFVVDNDLSNYSNASSNFFDTAGNGLTSTGSTVNVVGGDGITANSNEIEVTVDGSTIELSASDGTGAVRVKDGGITFAKLSGAGYLTSLEAFSDSDTQLMTAKAINDRIESFGYSTTDGTVTSVSTGTGLTGGPITTTGTISIANGGVDTLQLAADAVTGDKIEDAAVNSEHIANGAIDLIHMSANSVDSDQYVDGSIDTAHVSAGAITEAKRTRSVDSTFSNSDVINSDINLVAGGAGGISITLPSVASGKMVIVKKTDSAAGTVTVNRGGSSTIDGATSKVLYYQYESMTFVCDGTNWHVV